MHAMKKMKEVNVLLGWQEVGQRPSEEGPLMWRPEW